MGKEFSGRLVGRDEPLAIVVSRFNDFITGRLLAGAKDELVRHGVPEAKIDVAWVPGAVEIPLAAQRLAASGRYKVVICLGAIIRGGTSHNELVASEAARGIGRIYRETGVPAVFGVVTTDNIEQAVERAGTKQGNRGAEAARTALELMDLLAQIDGAK